jgi:hypothetical protein
VSFVDFAPTVLSLAGVKAPEHMQGRAFAGSAKSPPNEFVFCTRDRMDERYDMIRSVMNQRWLYIRNYRPDFPYVQRLDYQFRARGYQSWARVASEGKLTAATSMFWGEKPTEELYDMSADPDSIHNLAGDSTHMAVLESMRAALRKHSLEVYDNGFIPEGSALEGYTQSRMKGAVPFERVLDLANTASERDPKNLSRLIDSLEDPSEPVRWWAAQGCAILRGEAGAARDALLNRLKDPSGAVRVAAAESLLYLGAEAQALSALEEVLGDRTNTGFALLAANVFSRIGEKARPSLPELRRLLAGFEAAYQSKGEDKYGPRYPVDILKKTISILDGDSMPLVYPPAATAHSSQ